MASEQQVQERCGGKCELCASTQDLSIYSVPASEGRPDAEIMVCGVCRSQLEQPALIEAEHWRGLSDSMWSPVPAVQVLAWRMLKRLSGESWAQDLLDMLYLDEDLSEWAAADTSVGVEAAALTRDCNGAILQAGDTVTIIKDLDVKGANFTAKRGTAVRGIALTDNPEHIEGKVNGTRIVLLTCYVKKSV